MATWTITIDFQDGGGARDIKSLVLVNTIKRKRRIWTDLKPTIDTVSFSLIHNATIWNLLLEEEDDFLLVMTKDGSPYFSGVVYTNFDATAAATAEKLKLEAADPGVLLKRKDIEPATPEQWVDYYVCNTAAKASSIVHQLLYDAGVADGDIDATNITTQLDFYTNTDEDVKYFDRLAELLYEFGYVFYHDESGTFKMFNYLPSSISPADTFDNTNMRDRIRLKKTQEKYEGVQVKWNAVETILDAVVFSDTTGGGEGGHKARIPIAAGEYYPPDSDSRVFFAEYRIDGKEIVTVVNATLDWTHDADIVNDTFTDYFTKASVGFSNGGSYTQYLYKFDIVGDARVRGDINFTKRLNVSGTKKLLKLESRYLVTLTLAQKLADGVARYYEFNDFRYTIDSEDDVPVGGVVTITDTKTIGFTTTAIVVEKTNDEKTGRYSYVCEGISAYSARTTETEGVIGIPAAPVPGQIAIVPVAPSDEDLVAHYPLNGSEEDISGNGRHGALTPGVGGYEPAIAGKGYHFDGADSVISLPSSLGTLTSFSVAAWISADTLSPVSGFNRVVGLREAGGDAIVLYLNSTGNDSLYFLFNDGATPYQIQSDAAILASVWYHMVATYDGSTLRLYVDAILQADTQAHSSGSLTPTLNAIGAQGDDHSAKWDGLLDEVRIYSKALSLSEITYLYLNPSGIAAIPLIPIAPDDESLVGYFSLNETLEDSSGRSNTGVLTPGAGDYIRGVVGHGYDFDGAFSQIQVNNPLTNGGSFSVCFWANMDTLASGATTRCFVADWQTWNPGGHQGFRVSTGLESAGGETDLVVWVCDGTHYSWAEALGVFEAGVTYFVAVTCDATGIVNMYIDGVLKQTAALARVYEQEGPIKIGHSGINNSWMDGLIDEVRLYDRVLSYSEVVFLFQGPGGPASTPTPPAPPPPPEGLVLYWPFDERSGLLAADMKGNYDGTVTLDSGGGWTDGPIGGAFNFDEDVIENATAGAELDSGSFSICGWFKLDTLPSVVGGHGIITLKANSGTTNWDVIFYVSSSDDTIRVGRYDTGGTLRQVSSGIVPVVGRWYFAAAIYDETYLKVYVDSVFSNKLNVSAYAWRDSGDHFVAGAVRVGYASHLEGSLSEIRVYDVALTRSEIITLYRNPAADSGAEVSLQRLLPESVDYTKVVPSNFMKLDGGEADLVGYWSLDGFSNVDEDEFADHSGNGGTAEVMAGSGALETAVVSNGYHFDGVDSYLRVLDSAPLSVTSDITISAWIKADVLGGLPNNIVAKDGNAAYRFRVLGSGYLDLLLNDGGGVSSGSDTGTVLVAGVQYFVSVTVDFATQIVTFYVNGAFSSSRSTSKTGIADTAGNLIIGSYLASNEPFDGVIDEIRIYERALSPYEILYLYLNPAGTVPRMLAADQVQANIIRAAAMYVNDAFLLTVQSPAFVAGDTGWQISRDGDAEFQDGTFRGKLYVEESFAAGAAFYVESDTFYPGFFTEVV